ncbi:MAG TPA: hypothetical protein VN032_07975 [Thermoanaerobaculia bacterium]|nr:hypothetical protein [Thermoanaerobaculia bacterium]
MRKSGPVLLCGLLLFAAAGATLRAQASAACPPQGDAKKPGIQQLNVLRARLEEPSDDDYDETADISALIAPGDDSLRWQNDTAVEITAYVLDVHDGGATSANCHSSNPADHDTILDLTPGVSVSDNSHRMIAVITPQWRRIMAKNRIDWSTPSIRAKYLQQYVTVRGWLLFNSEAAARSVNTAPLAGINVTRATAWEIHPVSGIELNDDSFEQQTRLERPAELYARSNAKNSEP